MIGKFLLLSGSTTLGEFIMKILFSAVVVLVCLFSGLAIANDDGTTDTIEGVPGHGGCTDGTGDDFLTTLFASDNGYAGNSFDVGAYAPVTIVGFDINLEAGIATHNIDVYYRAGTADGYELNPAEWTLLGTDNVVPAGDNLPTHVDVGGLFLDTGDTVGFIIITQEYSGIRYTNGGPNTYTNSDIEIITYRGLADGWPPSSAFSYRAWNGTVHYVYGTALDRTTWGSIKSTF